MESRIKAGRRLWYVSLTMPQTTVSWQKYRVYEGVVERDISHGSVTEYMVGGPTPYYFRTADIGRKVFFSKEEAEGQCLAMNKDNERKWGWADR